MIVKALEQNGAKVYIVGRRKEVLEKVAKEEAVSKHHSSHTYICFGGHGPSPTVTLSSAPIFCQFTSVFSFPV